jgi:hypothetical protein
MQEQHPSTTYDQKNQVRGAATGRLQLVRVTLAIMLADLLIQFLLGIWLNLFATFPSIASTPSSGMMSSMSSVMAGGMSALMVHMLNGYLLFILSIVVLAVSLYSGRTSIAVMGILGLVSILLAGISGLIFMFSGFQNNLYSYLMALGFISGLTVYFMELYFSIS